MAAADGDNASAAATRKSDNLLNLGHRLRPNVEFRQREEGLCPGVVYVVGSGTERDGRVELRELASNGGVHREAGSAKKDARLNSKQGRFKT